MMSLFFITENNSCVEFRPKDWWKAKDAEMREA